MLYGTMAKSTTNVIQKKKIGRPVEIGADKLVAMRLSTALLEQVDEWAAKKGVSRSEASRALIERGLKKR
jgi:predicted DNA-binding protein (UPF0251 family)